MHEVRETQQHIKQRMFHSYMWDNVHVVYVQIRMKSEREMKNKEKIR